MGTIPNEAIEELKCGTCKNYLSYLPVYVHKETGVDICGRCWTLDCKNEHKYKRNILYEKLAKYIKFPCQYKNEGCEDVLYPAEAKTHEDSCIFKPFNCPLEEIEDCHWKGNYFQLTDHYREFHKELVIEKDKVELNFREDFNTKYLLISGKPYDEEFIVEMLRVNQSFNSTVYYFGPRRADLLSFTLVLNAVDCDFPEILPLYCCSYWDRKKITPGMVSFKADYVIGTFNISTSPSTIKDCTMSCFLCSKFQRGPIVTCEKGHIVCAACRTSHGENCSYTALSVNNELYQAIVQLKFHCRNRRKGCLFVCNYYERLLQQHQKVCAFNNEKKRVNCPKCDNTFPNYISLLDHAKEGCLAITDDNTFLNQWDLRQTPDQAQGARIYKICDNYIFLVNCWAKNEDLNIYVERLHCKTGPYYNDYFEIQFLDRFTSNPILVARKPIYLESVEWKVSRETVEDAVDRDDVVRYKFKILRK